MIIRCEQEGLRIDVFLSEQVETLSRSGAGSWRKREKFWWAESRSKRIIRPMRETRSPLRCRSGAGGASAGKYSAGYSV